MGIEVTLCITSYNRKNKLENCIDSFLKTTLFPLEKTEIVIVDNGSDDEKTCEYIQNLKIDKVGSFQKVINKKNDYPYCLRRAKNQAREIAKGKYFIDCPDDHIFVVKSNWIQDSINFLETTNEKISCICHYAYPLYRFHKPNNLMIPSSEDGDFFISQLKGYADYHIMSRSSYHDIGLYDETLEFSPNSESDYMERSYDMGYRRALLRNPVSIIVDENFFGPGKFAKLKAPLRIDDVKDLEVSGRPVSCEELKLLSERNSVLEVFSDE